MENINEAGDPGTADNSNEEDHGAAAEVSRPAVNINAVEDISAAVNINAVEDISAAMNINAVEDISAAGGAGKDICLQQPAAELQLLLRSLDEYFQARGDFSRIQVEPEGTEFQQRVWHCLRQIPYGQTLSYGEVAGKIGIPGAARAVGSACRANPIPLIIPCHRVIGSNGQLTGYAGGLWRKKWLLAHEQGKRRKAAVKI